MLKYEREEKTEVKVGLNDKERECLYSFYSKRVIFCFKELTTVNILSDWQIIADNT